MRVFVVRATALGPIVTAMAQINVPISRLLEEACVPQIDCCNPNDWVSSERLLHLGDLARRKAEIPSFEFLAAQAGTIADMGQFGKHLIQAPNLSEALNRYCDNHIYYRSSANCYLMRGQKVVWLCRQSNGQFPVGSEQLELYMLAEMIKLVRLAMGPDWWPARLYFESDRAPSFQDMAEDAGVELRFRQEFGGFAIPLSMMSLPLRDAEGSATNEYFQNEDEEFWKPASEDFVGSLRQILPCYMRDGEIKIDKVAEIFGLSVRTLQRQFAIHGLCYRDVLEQVRFQFALKLLKQDDIKLIEIAIELGYAHAASFTRAFHRWAGVSPKMYRVQPEMKIRRPYTGVYSGQA